MFLPNTTQDPSAPEAFRDIRTQFSASPATANSHRAVRPGALEPVNPSCGQRARGIRSIRPAHEAGPRPGSGERPSGRVGSGACEPADPPSVISEYTKSVSW